MFDRAQHASGKREDGTDCLFRHLVLPVMPPVSLMTKLAIKLSHMRDLHAADCCPNVLMDNNSLSLNKADCNHCFERSYNLANLLQDAICIIDKLVTVLCARGQLTV